MKNIISLLMIAIAVATAGAETVKQKSFVTADKTTGNRADWFGSSISTDGEYVIVGAPYTDEGKITFGHGQPNETGFVEYIPSMEVEKHNVGGAYIFKNLNGRLKSYGLVKSAKPDPGSEFGKSVCVKGDLAIVGAPLYDVENAEVIKDAGHDNSGWNAGKAFIFKRSGKEWKEVAALRATPSIKCTEFGSSVAIDGDIAVVGARTYSYGVKGADIEDDINKPTVKDVEGHKCYGAAFVFKNEGGTWKQVKRLENSVDPWKFGSQFGHSAVITEKYILIGANNHKQDGAVYIFDRNDLDKKPVLIRPPVCKGTFIQFAHDLDIQGDTLVVGARFGDVELDGDNTSNFSFVSKKGYNAGKAYIFKKQGEEWKLDQELFACDYKRNDAFGSSVAIDGDYIVVGAAYADGAARSEGKVYLFKKGEDGKYKEAGQFKHADAKMNDIFGTAIELSGNHVLVGAPHRDKQGMFDAGAVYVFEIKQ